MKRLATANQSLQSLLYNQEHTFSVEKYITKMKEAFNMIEDNKEPWAEREKVSLMLQKMNTNNVQV